jgi:hypothetical protein
MQGLHSGKPTVSKHHHMNSLCAVVYTSTSVRTLSAEETEEMLFDARNFNSDVGVTGALLQHDLTFFQYFEGPQDGVQKVYNRIRKSSTHENIIELFNEPIRQRVFSDWLIGFTQVPDSLILQSEQARWRKEAAIQNSTHIQDSALELLLQFWRKRDRGKA